MQLAILGRQNKLGLAELESIVGAQHVTPAGSFAALINGQLDGSRLGSVIRLADPITEFPLAAWRDTAPLLEKQLLAHLAQLPEGKIKLGISIFGMPVNQRDLFATGLRLKKAAQAVGRSVRIIPNASSELNSAQVLHNKLTGNLGIELLVVKANTTTYLARTTWIQDIDDYAKRDFGRPKRDAFVGMLPPKLAQTMLNLAQVKEGQTVLDPFCGTGVVLQEALLAGATARGSDISEKMIDFSRQNLDWLNQAYHVRAKLSGLELGDATTYQWPGAVEHVVCETYLGQPLSGLPKPEKLAEITQQCELILTKFLKNAARQLKPGTRCAIAVPAWRVGNHFKHLKLLDRLEELGYNRVRFTHARWDDLIYHRKDQIVARELLVLITK